MGNPQKIYPKKFLRFNPFCHGIFWLLSLTLVFPLLSQDIQKGFNDTTGKDTAVAKGRTYSLGMLDLFLTAPVVVGGGREEDEVADKIRNKKDYFIQCYTNNLTKYDAYTFKVRFQFKIEPSGEVKEVNTVFRGTKNAVIINCIKNVIRQIRFKPLPKDSGICVVEQSFIFRVI